MTIESVVQDFFGSVLHRGDGSEDPLKKLRETTQRLENTERYFEAFIQQSPFLVWLKDFKYSDGNYIFVSRHVVKMFGHEGPENWVGKKDEDVFPYSYAPQYHQHDLDVLHSGKVTYIVEKTPFATDKEWSTVMAVRYPVRNEQGDIVAIGGMAWPYGKDYERGD